jgi:hypothetical protein
MKICVSLLEDFQKHMHFPLRDILWKQKIATRGSSEMTAGLITEEPHE